MYKLKKLLPAYLCFAAVIAVYYVVLYFIGETCILREITGVPCPACGMTRAFLSLIKLDFGGYMYYNPAAIPCAVAVILALHKNILFRAHARLIDTIVILLAAVVFVVYIFRLSLGIIP